MVRFWAVLAASIVLAGCATGRVSFTRISNDIYYDLAFPEPSDILAKLAATRGRPLPTRMRRLMGLLARKGYPGGLAFAVVRDELATAGREAPEGG